VNGIDITKPCWPERVGRRWRLGCGIYRDIGWLPHEWLGGILLISLWLRVGSCSGYLARDAVILGGLVLANGICIWWGARASGERGWRVRLGFYPLVLNGLYFLLASAVPAIHPDLEDDKLQAVEGWLLGGQLSLLWQDWVHPAATEALSFCYLWYLYYLFASQLEYFLGDLPLLKKHYAGLFSIYALGYLGYAAAPALGPHLALAGQYAAPLEGGWITAFTADLVASAGNGVDVFPSLHVANGLYLLLFDRCYQPRRYRLYRLPCLGLIAATLYLRYHYLVDVVAGAGLALCALWLAERTNPAARKYPS
jgi:membrane-associated phospholipid phosphatase